MANGLVVSTRKGLFSFRQGASGNWNAADAPLFPGDNVTLTFCDRRSGYWYAALNLGHFGVKLHRSEDQGETWHEIAVPAYPEGEFVYTADGKPPQPATLKIIWALESGGEDQPGRIWAGTMPGGLFRSENHGETWELIRSLWDLEDRKKWMGGGADHPGIHSICVDPRNSRRVSIAVSCGGAWISENDGDSWEVGKGMRAEFMPPDMQFDPVAQDPHFMVSCPSAPDQMWIQHHNGIFRSQDGARTWTEITDVKPSAFGFAVAVHPRESETAWFVPATKDERRIPVDGRFVVTRTRDGGRTFEILSKGLPAGPAFDIVYRHAFAIDDTGDVLAAGSTTGNLWISHNQGDDWVNLSTHLPPIHAVRFV